MSERNGESGAIACDERNDEWNQKNAGISGEINVMRQFDSSPNSEKGDRTDGTGKRGEGTMERRRGSLEAENTIVFRSRSPSRSYWFLRDAYFRNSSGSSDERPSVSLKLEWIFNGKASH